MPSLAQLKDELDTLRYQANQIFTEASSNGSLDFSLVKCIDGTTIEKEKKWADIQMRMSDAGAEYDRLKRIEAEMKMAVSDYQRDQQPVNAPPFEGKILNLRHQPLRAILDNSSEFKMLRERGQGIARLEIPYSEYKALITLGDVSPQNDRQPLVRMRMEERTVIDMLGESQVSSATVEWYEETTFTNEAAVVAEGQPKQESSLDWTLRTASIPTIATWIPVTVQALQDNDFLDSEIRNRLVFMVRRVEEAAAINAILSNLGIQDQPQDADNIASAIFHAMQLVRGSDDAGFLEPDGIVMHPADFGSLITLQSASTESYLVQAILQQTPENRLWGVPIRQTTAITQGTVLVGAFDRGGEVYRRGGLSVAASTEHADFFIRNQVAIRAESRMVTAVQIPAAFATMEIGSTS